MNLNCKAIAIPVQSGSLLCHCQPYPSLSSKVLMQGRRWRKNFRTSEYSAESLMNTWKRHYFCSFHLNINFYFLKFESDYFQVIQRLGYIHRPPSKGQEIILISSSSSYLPTHLWAPKSRSNFCVVTMIEKVSTFSMIAHLLYVTSLMENRRKTQVLLLLHAGGHFYKVNL